MLNKLKYLKSYFLKKYTSNSMEFFQKPIATSLITKNVRYLISSNNGLNTSSETAIKDNVRIINGEEIIVDNLPIYNKAPLVSLNDFKCIIFSQYDVFSYNPISNTSYLIKNLGNNIANIKNGPEIMSDGFLYGTSRSGGTGIQGVLFKMNPNNYDIEILHSFATGGGNGYGPVAPPVEYTSGRLFGLLYDGGANSAGVIYEYNYLTNTYTKKYDLQANYRPWDTFTLVSTGKMYFTCMTGANSSVLCEYDPELNTVTDIQTFDNSINVNGNNVKTSPIDYNGSIYGISAYGGNLANRQVIWQYNYTTPQFTVLHDGTSSDGYAQIARNFLFNGKLYGVTVSGGANGAGTIYEFNLSNNIYTVLYDMPTGNSFETTLVHHNGLLYGYKPGSIFTFDLNSSTFLIKHSLNTASQSIPYQGSIHKI